MFEWNKPFQLVMKIKKDYKNTYGLDTLDFETWLMKLNKKEYNDVFECLQINQCNEFLLIRYGIADMQESMWTDKDSIYRECRSVVIDLDEEQLVLTPFRKFFNLDEVEENSLKEIENKIKEAQAIEITDKLDGSMQSARWYNEEAFMAGSMALNPDDSWRLKDGYSKLTENHLKMIKENPDLTFIFEYISLKDAHVVLYSKEEEGLYLIGIRNVYTGHEFSYKTINEIAQKYNVPMAKIENRTFKEIMELSKEVKANEKEGWILNIIENRSSYHKVKIKCDDYIKLHRLLDKLSSVNVIIENIADGKYDDMISKVPENYKNRVQSIANKIFEYKCEIEMLIEECFSKSPRDDKKTFMIWVDNNCPDKIKGYVRCKYLNRNFNVLKNSSNGYKKLKDLGICEDYSALFADLEG
ncbi:MULTISPECIES: T4 RnlA family RNA ligase [unclassified Clostridium]|uniref:T4 RnlA family RNA ligase n=1 Tax=unclassified Clostridium TaxID=2614128 RepID=UPI0025BF0BE3|nr:MULTISPECIES: T4 RnlA family RNA ligase [unclassified Clostridium]